jgi:hypothetical protein
MPVLGSDANAMPGSNAVPLPAAETVPAGPVVESSKLFVNGLYLYGMAIKYE